MSHYDYYGRADYTVTEPKPRSLGEFITEIVDAVEDMIFNR